MKILALGATGAIGQPLVELLADMGHLIHVTSRRAQVAENGVLPVQGDARDDDFLAGLLGERWDAILDFMVYDTAGFRRRIDRLLAATGQYVFISTARVFAESAEPITELSPTLLDVCTDAAYLATDEYALTKARQEDLLKTSGQTNWTIVRPYITFGPGRLQLGTLEKEDWLYRALHGRKFLFCDALMGKFTTMTDSLDVARMMAALVGHPDARGEAFNLTTDQSLLWSEVLTLYLDTLEAHMGHRPCVELQDLDTFCGLAASVAQVRHDRMFDRRFNPARIKALAKLDQFSDSRTALRDRLIAQLETGQFLPIDWRAEARRDRASGEHAALSELRNLISMRRYLLHRHIPLAMIRRLRSK